MILAFLLVSPFNYKRHELRLFYDYEKKTKEEKPSMNNEFFTKRFLKQKEGQYFPIECHVFFFSIKKFFRNLMKGSHKHDNVKR